MTVRTADSTPAPRVRPRLQRAGDRRDGSGPVVLVLRGNERFTTRMRGAIEHLAIGRFPNGELHLELPAQVERRECVVVGSVSPPPGNIERLTLAAQTLRRAGAERVTALLPYLAYARQDSAAPRESLGLAWVGELLRASGVSDVVTVDVHSDRASELLGLPLTSLSPAALMATALLSEWREQVTFVAPDEGAIERCAAVAQAAGVDRPIVWARKRRTTAGIEHLGLVGRPAVRAVIVDDILDTGATLVSCSRRLREAGVGRIGVIATHGLFTGERWRALFSEGVQEMWITDAVLSRRRPPQAHVVSIAPLLDTVLDGRRD